MASTGSRVALVVATSALGALLASGCSAASVANSTDLPLALSAQPHQTSNTVRRVGGVQHIVIFTMENRSFDEMFGTYPGVNGIPNPAPCNPDPNSGQIVCLYHSHTLVEYGGPHGDLAERVDLDGGKLDGFITAAEMVRQGQPNHDPYPDEVMGYHTCNDLPVYCRFARRGVLADNFYSATTSFSTPAHLFMVSNWSAKCLIPRDPLSCYSFNDPNVKTNPPPDFAWTDITWLLHKAGVSWGYYVYTDKFVSMLPGDTADGEAPIPDSVYNEVSDWNPLPAFDDVKEDGEFANLQPGASFIAALETGTLPAISWVIPPFKSSDHPTASLADGQMWLTNEVSAVETSVYAPSTLVIIWWDDWGGFYDHVVPFTVDSLGYGFRTPLILLGPMVKAGTIDHQLLSTDAFNKLIEDLFLGSRRIDPVTDGRPDPRPDVREADPYLGDLRKDLKPFGPVPPH
ncbi:MAG TPA: alkaline phosphatase family protein [Candidatus Eremiobacteraceae bacterium]|nr:alkaline phosphatase family protein [Candidatus Eremiobacteraceae bacterium]